MVAAVAAAGAVLLHRAGTARGPVAAGVEEILEQADEALLAGRLTDAESAFRRVLDDEVAGTRASFGLGLALLRSGRFNEAIDALEAAAARDPSNADYAFVRARALASAGRGDDAIAAYQALVEAHPERPAALEDLLRLLAERGRAEEAEHLAMEAVARWPDRFELRMIAGGLLSGRGRHADAAAQLVEARRLRPYSPEAVYAQIAALRKLDRIQEALDLMPEFQRLQSRARAIEDLARRAGVSPSDATILAALVDSLLADGRREEAAEQAERYLATFPAAPGAPRLALRAAEAALEAGDVQAARRLVDGAERTQAASLDQRLEGARLRLRMGDFLGAAAGFDACVRIAPGDGRGVLGRARALLGAGELEAAQADLLAALAAHPRDASVHATLGLLQVRQGDERGALGTFKEALALDAENLEASFGLGFVAYKRQELKEAEGLLRKVVGREPDHREAQAMLALVLADQGRCAEAQPALIRGLALDPRNARLYAALAQCYEWSGLTEASERVRREAERVLDAPR